jgi:hypothetical protein
MSSIARRGVATVASLAILSLGGAVLGGVALGGCASGGPFDPHGLAFRRDDSIKIAVPEDRELVSEPLSVEWKQEPMTQQVAGYLLFVDRGPQPPGKTIEHFAEDNRAKIYSAVKSPFQIPVIERRDGVAKKVRDQHELIIVPVDLAGRRIGETSAVVHFTVFVDQG